MNTLNESLPYTELKKACDTFPSAPGTYLMKDNNDKIIYIGKAKNLKKRIFSYFNYLKNELYGKPNKDTHEKESKNHKNTWKTIKLLQRISEIEFIITDNEVEALLLESNLIKKYRPVFNIDLKDQERYTFLKITEEEFPRLLVTRRNRSGNFTGPPGEIFGPFVYGGARFISIGALRKIFKVRICNRLPKRPCLEYFINNCEAPCINKITREKYNKNIESLKEVLNNKDGIQGFLAKMNKEMRDASSKQNYELAKEIRDTVRIIGNLRIKQKIDLNSKKDEEYVGFKIDKSYQKGHVLILKRLNGVICDRKKFEFELLGDNTFSTFLLQYYSSGKIPETIYVNKIPESKRNLELSLQKLTNYTVKIKKISKSNDEKNKNDLMNLILKNLSLHIEKKFNPVVVYLKEEINMNEIPIIIDCFDISNFGSSFAVGSCVRFVNGTPFKSGYRRFKIKTIMEKQDDFAMIKEIIRRRYTVKKIKLNENVQNIFKNSNLLLETSSNDKFIEAMPNLILIDGGEGQLNAALKALTERNLKIPTIALAKENEEIFLPNKYESLKLLKKNPVLQLLQTIRDEAHRFGLSYNRTLRKIQYTS